MSTLYTNMINVYILGALILILFALIGLLAKKESKGK